ncbi:hypothetical protein [Subtercola endophyticus]|uniref:hypothetical protein n=1 Tax=Subtercola endophyticus TaxID=2895559 RepID=UPI001E376F4C|nr:hypothetical protein [Subtercola endophyticus]UFS58763.1 hypothetical protein LQ955_17475 [Subtercola endophyticus]
MADDGDESERSAPGFLPATAYAVLGVLSVHHEELTPSEIKVRAYWDFRNFYWSPAVSHIRRELARLLELGLVEQRAVDLSKDRITHLYQSTPEGDRALAHWVSESPVSETVVVKNSVLLKVYFADSESAPAALAVIDARLTEVDEAIRTTQWGHRRMVELGMSENPALLFPRAVNDHMLRALYFEQGNLRQLRDTIVGFDAEAFSHDETIKRLPIRPRREPIDEKEGPAASE